MKKLVSIFLLLLLTQCGYSTIYKEDLKDLAIEIIDVQGNTGMNNLIRSELRTYLRNTSNEKYIIKINSDYNKTIISKDSSGSALNFKINTKIKFQIILDKTVKEFIVEENFNMKNSSNKFEMKNYEEIIKKNFAKSIKEKLILKLNTMK